MTYRITDGISQSSLPRWLKSAQAKYGTYKDGGVDYGKAEIAPIVMCTVLAEGKILIAKRGYGLADAEGYWSTINGFIDKDMPVTEIAKQELAEELGLDIDASQIKVASSYTLRNTAEKRSYIVFACLINLPKIPKVKLDREHTDYAWINRDELDDYHILEDLPVAIDAALLLK